MSFHRALFVVAVTSLVSACSRGPSGTVAFGVAGPEADDHGKANRKGVELAIDEFNNTAGQSFKLEAVFRNDSAKGDRAASIAQEFVTDRSEEHTSELQSRG